MNRSVRLMLVCATALAGCAMVNAASGEWLSAFPVGQGDIVSKRLDAYVKLSKSRSWGKLYDFVCATALGGVNRQTFISKMTMAHGTKFANSPDLLTFRPSRASILADGQYDIYGCAKATREGREYNGIAVTHVVFEGGNWFFAGWSFTEFPNVPCRALSDPTWESPPTMEWGLPMEELRDAGGAPIHIDRPRK